MEDLTGDRDANYNILNRLSDQELVNFCETSKKLHDLCNDDELWRIRTYEKLGRYLSPLNPSDFIVTNWKDYYTGMVKNIREYLNGKITFFRGNPVKTENKLFPGSNIGIPGGNSKRSEIKGEDVKTVLNAIEKENKEYYNAMIAGDLDKIKTMISNEFIDVNRPIPSIPAATGVKILEFLFRESETNHRIKKHLVEQNLKSIANEIVYALHTGVADEAYVNNISLSYPILGQFIISQLNNLNYFKDLFK